MMYLCQNGVDYGDCLELTPTKGCLCGDCEEKLYEQQLEAAYGGDAPYTAKERHEALIKDLEKIGEA